MATITADQQPSPPPIGVSSDSVAMGVPTAGPISFTVAAVVMFVLAYGFPTDWFVVDRGGFDSVAAPPQGFVPFILALAAGFAFVSTLHVAETYLRLVTVEPLLTIFVLLAVVSVLWSEFPAQTLRFAVPLVVVVYLGYWMVSVFRLDQLLAILLVVLAAGLLLQVVFIFALPQYGQSALGFSGTATDKNVLGRLMAFSTFHFLIGAGVFPRFRILLGVFGAASAGLVVGSESATSLTGLSFTVGMLILCRVFRSRKTLYGAISTGVVGGGAIAVFIATANLGFLTGILGKDVTLTGRTVLWELSIREGFNRPLLGHGWGGFWQGWLSPSRPVLDGNNWLPPHAHNALVDYFLVLGIVGVLLASGFFVRLFVRSARAVRTRPGTLGLWPIAYSSFCFVFSISEFGVVSRSIFLLFLTVHVSVAGLERRGRAQASGSPRLPKKEIEVVLT